MYKPLMKFLGLHPLGLFYYGMPLEMVHDSKLWDIFKSIIDFWVVQWTSFLSQFYIIPSMGLPFALLGAIAMTISKPTQASIWKL